MNKLFKGLFGLFLLTFIAIPEIASAKLDESTRKEIDTYLEKKFGEKKSWLPSGKGEFFELKGELELEFVATNNEDKYDKRVFGARESRYHTDVKKAHAQLDKIVLQPIAHFGKNNFLKLEMEFGNDGDSGGEVTVPEFYFQSNHLLGEDIPADLWLRLGRDERWMKGKRLTETYPILGTIAWRDDQLQLVLGVDTDYVYWRGSLGSGLDLGSRAIGEDNSFRVMQDDNNYTKSEQKREFSTGLGFKVGDKKLGADLLFYYINDKMNQDEDVDVLDDLPGYHDIESGKPYNKQHRTGGRLTLNGYGAQLMGEYLNMLDGRLRRHVWYVQASYKQKLPGFDLNGRKWLTAITPVVRYNKLDVIINKDPEDSRTWDRSATTVALLIELIKHVQIKNEFTWNWEKTGAPYSVDNNEFLTQLEVKF